MISGEGHLQKRDRVSHNTPPHQQATRLGAVTPTRNAPWRRHAKQRALALSRQQPTRLCADKQRVFTLTRLYTTPLRADKRE